MRYGFYLPTRGPTATRDGVLALAREGERLGLHSAMIADHIVFPVESKSAYPYTLDRKHPGGGDALETFSILGVVAGATERLRLVTSVLVLPYRNPVLTAKMVASLDVLSGGRVTLGVGVGWLKEEFEALDSPDFDRRGAVTDEWIAIFKQLWTAVARQLHRPVLPTMPTSAASPSRCRSRIRRSGSAAIRAPRCAAPRGTAMAGTRSAPSPPRRCRRRKCGRISQTLKRMTEAEGRDFSALTISYKAPLYDTGIPDRDGTRRSFSGQPERDRRRHPLVRRHRRARADLRLPRRVASPTASSACNASPPR